MCLLKINHNPWEQWGRGVCRCADSNLGFGATTILAFAFRAIPSRAGLDRPESNRPFGIFPNFPTVPSVPE